MYNLSRTIVITLLTLVSISANAAQCLFVSSYHAGHQWSDGIEKSLYKTLNGKCNIKSFYMNTKHDNSEEYIQKVALEAKRLIDSTNPDVVITSDDNAAKYIITPYYRNSKTPFIFSGVNWSAEKYGFPFRNVTGMIEVAAIDQLFDSTNAITGKINNAYYIGENTKSEEKYLNRIITASSKRNIQIKSRLVDTMEDWLDAYKKAQSYDLIIIGTNTSIDGWNKEIALSSILETSTTLTTTAEELMMPYTMLGIIKAPEEQGEWAGQVAIEILNGVKPSDIPIVPNRRFNIIINKTILSASKIQLPAFLKLKANTYH